MGLRAASAALPIQAKPAGIGAPVKPAVVQMIHPAFFEHNFWAPPVLDMDLDTLEVKGWIPNPRSPDGVRARLGMAVGNLVLGTDLEPDEALERERICAAALKSGISEQLVVRALEESPNNNALLKTALRNPTTRYARIDRRIGIHVLPVRKIIKAHGEFLGTLTFNKNTSIYKLVASKVQSAFRQCRLMANTFTAPELVLALSTASSTKRTQKSTKKSVAINPEVIAGHLHENFTVFVGFHQHFGTIDRLLEVLEWIREDVGSGSFRLQKKFSVLDFKLLDMHDALNEAIQPGEVASCLFAFNQQLESLCKKDGKLLLSELEFAEGAGENLIDLTKQAAKASTQVARMPITIIATDSLNAVELKFPLSCDNSPQLANDILNASTSGATGYTVLGQPVYHSSRGSSLASSPGTVFWININNTTRQIVAMGKHISGGSAVYAIKYLAPRVKLEVPSNQLLKNRIDLNMTANYKLKDA